MTTPRVPLFQRLPEIYRTKDAEAPDPDQLRAYLSLVEDVFGAVHENIEALYHDLFIETCDDWVIPYIGDLLGTSHLKGETWTLRADVADTIALRRRKGTLGAIELLTYDLTRWGVHCVELRENLVWNQHLNHQRPDDGGLPPYRDPNPQIKRQTVIRGGTVTLRDPAMLSLLGSPFDSFAHVADVKPPADGSIRYNLPNLGIFLWRLTAYRIRVSKPIHRDDASTGLVAPVGVVRFSINPVDRPYLTVERDREPVRLFNTNLVDININKRTGIESLDHSRLPPSISLIDETPGPIPTPRLTSDAAAGNPEAYVSVETYDATATDLSGLDLADVGLQLHLPQANFAGELFPLLPDQPPAWKIRGANLCNWEAGLLPALAVGEIAIDPVIGRLVIGAGTAPRAAALIDELLITYTYGSVGPVGAHPESRSPVETGAVRRWVSLFPPPLASIPPGVTVFSTLAEALTDIHDAGPPIVVEIQDSMRHVLDLADPPLTLGQETLSEDGNLSLLLNRRLVIRSATDQRPIVELAQPLRFRPVENFDVADLPQLSVRLEGLYLTRGEDFPTDLLGGHNVPLVARAALNELQITGCTLDPGNYKSIHEDRQPTLISMSLDQSYEFEDAGEESAFNQTPNIILQRTISGPLLIDSGYRLNISDSIIDAGQGVDDNSVDKFALTSATADPDEGWGPPTVINGVTIFGRMRVESIEGRGGIWVHALEVLDNQKGCIKFSYFSGESLDRLPQNHACVKGTDARLVFRSEVFGEPAYGQLAPSADYRIRERGPKDDAMGAFGFLLEAHKWRNLQIRFREFMPVGVRPLLIPVT